MPSETPLTSIDPTSSQKDASSRSKFRIRFCKSGELRFVSHHDLMHVCERMFRRADLPIPVTQGFNPRPRMWFALSLALGVAGLHEILEIEVSQPMAADEVQRRLALQCPPGLDIVSVRVIDAKTSARVRRAFYRLALAEPIEGLRERCDTFLRGDACWIERTRPVHRRINVRPFVHELHFNGDRLEMALWITSNGAARADEIITALGLKPLLDEGGLIERIDLEVYDELPADAERPPIERFAVEEITTNDSVARAPRPTAIVESPMSFET